MLHRILRKYDGAKERCIPADYNINRSWEAVSEPLSADI